MRLLAAIYIIVLAQPAFAADGLYRSGAPAAGMGNAALTSKNVWSLFHNPSCIAFMRKAAVGISYEQRFSMKELSQNALAAAIPLHKTGAIGINAVYYGFKNYNEQLAGITYAHKFNDRIAAGVKLNYQAFAIGNEYGSRSLLTGEVSMLARIAGDLWLGAHIYNPAQAELTEHPSEKIPSSFSFGAGYIFSEKFRVEAATEKKDPDKALFRAGMEYHPVRQFYLRAGISSQPYSSAFGFGLDLNGFLLDFAAGFHQQLGFTPHLSLSYLFKGKE